MALNNEAIRINNFFNDLDELLQGHHYYTVYYQSSHEHTRIFRYKSVKKCLHYAFLVTLLIQLNDVLFYDKDTPMMPSNMSSPHPHSSPSQTMHFMDGNMKKDHVRKNNNNNNFASPRKTLDNGKQALNVEQGQAQKESGGTRQHETQTSSYHWLDASFGFLWKYFLVTVSLYSIFYLIPALLSILYSVYVRHVIAKKKKNLICGLFRFKRVRSKD